MPAILKEVEFLGPSKMNFFAIQVIIGSVLVGAFLGKFFYNRRKNKGSKDDKILRVINNPRLLVEKLNANGPIYSHTKELKYDVVEEGGKEIVKLTEIQVPKQKQKQLDRITQPGKNKVEIPKELDIKTKSLTKEVKQDIVGKGNKKKKKKHRHRKNQNKKDKAEWSSGS